ncbi:MAG: SAF domain-containing protein [Clostridiales Family XIII bacterium]|nr:SAF domain-containing protein [Clostridiales Family XIII bacterium]
MANGLRRFSGIFLIIVAVAGLVLWEAKGRELVLMADVCAAAGNIEQGEKLDPSMFRTVSVPRGSLVSGAVAPRGLAQVNGGIAAGFIPEGAMLSTAYIDTPQEISRKDDSYFTIERKWILMRSSALRRGDMAEILTADGAQSLGVFEIGFVKDAEDSEVRETAGGTGFGSAPSESRVDATSPIDHVEIVARLSEYLAIRDYAESAAGPSLILVGKEIVE